ncbi:hypothetical protein IWGMT90018_34480 [Mycobacterium kiyosense]|nr:hypothetical protein IWGMT90018_34480 [Mycobacterium kiyosense]
MTSSEPAVEDELTQVVRLGIGTVDVFDRQWLIHFDRLGELFDRSGSLDRKAGLYEEEWLGKNRR